MGNKGGGPRRRGNVITTQSWKDSLCLQRTPVHMLALVQEPLSTHRLLSDDAKASSSFQAFMQWNDDRSE